LGGDLKVVRTEIASRTAELAGTKAELSGTKAELTATTEEVEKLRRLREQAEKEAAQFRALATRLKSMIDAGQLEVVMRDGRINLKLPDNILFPSGSKNLKRGGRAALVQVAEALKGMEDRDFLIAGHTDNIPLKRGYRFKDNWELSTARAVEVVRLMVKNGVAADQLVAAGYGEHDPIAPNDTKEGRAQNRRLEIVLMPKIENIDL
ncbi:MAG: flagellar motor protein MotB, partial [Myxococcota bacterium]